MHFPYANAAYIEAIAEAEWLHVRLRPALVKLLAQFDAVIVWP
jgi:hypothetical protein